MQWDIVLHWLQMNTAGGDILLAREGDESARHAPRKHQTLTCRATADLH